MSAKVSSRTSRSEEGRKRKRGVHQRIDDAPNEVPLPLTLLKRTGKGRKSSRKGKSRKGK